MYKALPPLIPRALSRVDRLKSLKAEGLDISVIVDEGM